MREWTFDWSALAFGSKKPLKELHATFIAAPRELSTARFAQLLKTYLPQGNVVIGIAREEFVLGLEGQPQFKMLREKSVEKLITKVHASSSEHKAYTLLYSQRDLAFIFEKVRFARAVFVNGSWYFPFHQRPEFYALVSQHVPYELVSPFVDEQEAKMYAESRMLAPVPSKGTFGEAEMLRLANDAAKQSYASSGFQTGVAIGRRNKNGEYSLLITAHNQILPYETYAMHFGSAREKHFSPTNDLNHYDAIHAEMAALVLAQRANVNLAGASLFINLLPCPQCARALALTDLNEIMYREDHSAGYAVQLFEQMGKKVRRVLPEHLTP